MIDQKLVTLLTVIKTGSYTRAAAVLNLTQPAVSHQIKQLEEEYGINIFYPKTRKIKLTPEGEILERYAKKEQALYKTFVKELELSASGERPFKIGLTPTAEVNIVPDVIAHYCAEHPDIKISIISDTVKKLHNKISNRSLDLAIIEGSISDQDLKSRLLDTDYLCLITSTEHPLAQKKHVTLEDIKNVPLIMRPQTAGTRILFETYLENLGKKLKDFNIIMEIDNVSTLKALVKSNLGVSIIAHSSCIHDYNRGRIKIIPIQDFAISREIQLIYHKDFAYPAMIDELCSYYSISKQDVWSNFENPS